MVDNAIVSFDLGFQNRLFELQQILDEAIAHAMFNNKDLSTEEGYIEASLPNYHQRSAGNKSITIGIYCSLGPYRMHYFDGIDKALAAVRQWYEEEVTDCSSCERCLKS